MQKTTKRRSRFMRKQANTNTYGKTVPQASLSCKLYRNIHELPLNRFITCICDDDLTALLIEGVATPDELVYAWEIIYNEFIDSLKDENLRHVDELTIKYNLLSTKHNVIKLLVDAVTYAPVDSLIDELKQWYELPVTLNRKDKTGFKRDLAVITARNQRWLNDAMQLAKQIEQLKPAQVEDVKITRAWFDEQIVAISRFNKYHINKNETTVGEFVVMINHMKASAASVQNQISNN